MARIQILPLPTIRVGDSERTPFVLILDQIADDEAWRPEDIEHIKNETGAVSVIGHYGTMDAPGSLKLTDEQQADMLAYLTQPRRWVSDLRYGDADAALTVTAGRIIPGSLID